MTDAASPLLAPFPYFGGKRTVAADVWARLGEPKQYIEPFCGSAAVLLAAPKPASLEVINDGSGYIANFWRAAKHQPVAVAEWADYPVSHLDLGARHKWLLDQRGRVGEMLQDPDWPGDAKVAGWWLWGQCSWIGSGWCEWDRERPLGSAGRGVQAAGKVPHISSPGRGVQAAGQVPHISSPGRGVQAAGQVPHIGNAGLGFMAIARTEAPGEMLTSGGRVALRWLRQLADRLERVLIVHGDWHRCLNNNYGGDNTAVFLDPPYRAYEALYGATRVADEVEAWARDNGHLHIALCGHVGDYDLPGWTAVQWDRGRATYSGSKTTDQECVWYSPACLTPKRQQMDIFEDAVA